MYNGREESEQNEKRSQKYQHVETLAREPAQISNIPPRASAHPSAMAAVRSRYPRNFSDRQPITPFDGISHRPLDLTRSAVSQRQTEDTFTEHIFRNREDVVPVDEIDTLPPDGRAQLRPGSKRSAYELASQVDPLPTSFVQEKQGEVYQRVETRRWAATQLPSGIGPRGKLQGFSIERCLDNVRWWLLFPGRLEFLLWLIGAIVLVCLTSFFLLLITVVWVR